MIDYEFLYVISGPIYIIFLIYLIVKKVSIGRIIVFSLFFLYIISLLSITILPLPIEGLNEIKNTFGENYNNYIPFASIFDILSNQNLGTFIKVKQVLGNIILFLPMGFLVPIIWKSKNVIKKALIIGLLSSFFIEILQFIISSFLGFNYKITDIDDIMLNTFGFIIGFYLYKISIKK
ncbi:hypothetical protein EOM39_01070 [Candidatus Gracilibacteria bacterium]|nr:hypothetical protein [Candidatus Gracilibacteria bacterium]